MAAADSRATALRNDTAAGAAGRRRRIRSSVFFRRPDSPPPFRDRPHHGGPRSTRPPPRRRLAPGSPIPTGTSCRLRDVSSGSLAGSDVQRRWVARDFGKTAVIVGGRRRRSRGVENGVRANRDFRRVPLKSLPTDQDGCIDGVGRLATLLTLPLTSFA